MLTHLALVTLEPIKSGKGFWEMEGRLTHQEILARLLPHTQWLSDSASYWAQVRAMIGGAELLARRTWIISR